MDFSKIADYVNRSVQGDTEAFTELYRATNHRVYFICFSFLKDEHEARDAVQDTYLKAYKNITKLSEPEKFSAWIESIAINRCKDILKKKVPIPVEDDILEENLTVEEELSLPEKYIIDAEKRKIVIDIMREQLSQLQYRTVILYYFNNLAISEIADIMECSEGAVKSRLNAARTKIKRGVEKYENNSGEKLFVFAGVPFLAMLLSEECKNTIAPDLSANIISEVSKIQLAGSVMPAGGGTSAQGANTIVTNSMKTVGKAGARIVKGKIIAGIAAVTVAVVGIIGGIALVSNLGGSDTSKASESKSEIMETVDSITEEQISQERKADSKSTKAESIEGESETTKADNQSEDVDYDKGGLKEYHFKIDGINGNVKTIGGSTDDFWLYIVTNDNKVYYNPDRTYQEMAIFCTLPSDFENIENKMLVDPFDYRGHLLVRNKNNSYTCYYGEEEEIDSINFTADHLAAVVFGGDILQVFTLKDKSLYVTLVDADGNILDENKPVMIEVINEHDSSYLPADDIQEVYPCQERLIVYKNDGTLYSCEPIFYDSVMEEYCIQQENRQKYEILNGVTGILGNTCGLSHNLAPFYTIQGDNDNFYIRGWGVTLEKEPYCVNMPDGCGLKDIETIYGDDAIYMIMQDGTVYIADFADDVKWRLNEELSDLYQKGKIVDFAFFIDDLLVLCDDGVVYEYDKYLYVDYYPFE